MKGNLLITHIIIREIAYSTGLSELLCQLFISCNNYLVGISNGTISLNMIKIAIQTPKFADAPVCVDVSLDTLSIATNISRMLRNLCCNNVHNQSCIIDYQLLPIVLSICFS